VEPFMQDAARSRPSKARGPSSLFDLSCMNGGFACH